ncbi:F0F1 ATP synthase subunit delta [Neisseria sp. Ec49-e6-T10]|uniref:F0F1 ATP synthase subunit delta n=1 Tax=Neisseria sp. Ec49-e6-T10 TaxID=3140744 RepID=UPI003EBCB326
MAEFVTIARPYAKALFSLAQQHNQLVAWYDELKMLATLASNPDVASVLDNPELSAGKRAEVLLELAGKVDSYISNFVSVLSENERLNVLPFILEVYERLMNEATHTKKVIIYSAFELTEQQKNELLVDLGKQISGKLEAEVEVKPELIGGVKVEVDDQVLDLSIQAKLDALYMTLKS